MEEACTNIAMEMHKWFLRFIEASINMNEEERRLSDMRNERYENEFRDYKNRMKDKYGLDGGPSPAIIFGEPFVFEGVAE